MSKTEAQIRKELIDVKLHNTRWDVSDRTKVIEEHDINIYLPQRVCEIQS